MRAGNPEPDRVGKSVLEVVSSEFVLALDRLATSSSNELAELRVGAVVRREQDDTITFGEAKVAADQQFDATFRRGLVCPHNPGEGALVGDRDGFVAELFGSLDEFAGVRRTALKGEVATAQEFRVVHGRCSRP
jgi:hypothetical protein